MRRQSPIHTGEVLREDFLFPLGLSAYRLAEDIGVPPRRINEIVNGRRTLSTDTAARRARYFIWPAEVWLNLQAHHGRQLAAAANKAILARIPPLPGSRGGIGCRFHWRAKFQSQLSV